MNSFRGALFLWTSPSALARPLAIRHVWLCEDSALRRVLSGASNWQQVDHYWHLIGGKHNNGERVACQVLLIPQLLICGDKNREVLLCGFEQIPIFSTRPSHFLDGRNGQLGQVGFHETRNRLVEKNGQER